MRKLLDIYPKELFADNLDLLRILKIFPCSVFIIFIHFILFNKNVQH